MLKAISDNWRKAARIVLLSICACATPFLITLSFAPYSIPLLAWVSLVPAIFLVSQARGWEHLFLVLSAALYAYLLYGWLSVFHPLAIPAAMILFGLVFYGLPLFLSGLIYRRSRLAGGLVLIFLLPFAEYLKTKGPVPFSVGTLGYSQYNFPGLIQVADITGVFGVSFLIVCVNAALFAAVETISAAIGRHPSMGGRKRAAIVLSGIAVASLGASLAYGSARLRIPLAPAGATVELAQFNHLPHTDWKPMQAHYLDEYESMAGLAQDKPVDLVVFPENTVMTYVSLDIHRQPEGSVEILNRLSAIAKRWKRPVVYNVLETSGAGTGRVSYNSCILFDAKGDLVSLYRKVLLAPLGEYNPFKLLGFLDRLVMTQTDAIRLARGPGRAPMRFATQSGEQMAFGMLICFEGADGDWTRGYGRSGVDFLVNVSSDRWTESPGAVMQLAGPAVFRAVENRMSMVRVGNGGFSCVVDPRGVVAGSLPLFRRGTLVAEIARTEKRMRTVYQAVGDVFAMFCGAAATAAALLWLIARGGPRRRSRGIRKTKGEAR